MTVEIEGVTLHLAHPDELTVRWVGQEELMRQLLAAWLVVNEQDLPMNPRLLGKPGVGKTTLAYAAARRLGREVYIMQATMDTRPEDLLVTPVIEGEGQLRYVASPLVTAMIRGGVAILDEGNRMSEKSWASLAPLLDNRRYVESIVAGIKIKAHPHFRLVTTMNDDASTFELPEYIHSRLQPQILIDFPERDEEYHILKENLPFAEERILNYVTEFLQQAHAADERYTVRDGINIGRFAIKLKSLATERVHELAALETAIIQDAGRGGAAVCPGTQASLNPASRNRSPAACSAAVSPTFRSCPDGWSSPLRCARPSCATARKWWRSNCPRRCSTHTCAPSTGCPRCRSSSIRTTAKRTGPSTSPSSRPIPSWKPSAARRRSAPSFSSPIRIRASGRT